MPTINTSPYPLNTLMDTPATTSTTTPWPEDQESRAPVHGSRSLGPFFAVMSVIIVLLAVSCILGRYFGSRAEGPDSSYDCLGWCRRRFVHRRRCVLGCGDVAATVMDLDPKLRDSRQLSLASPQP